MDMEMDMNMELGHGTWKWNLDMELGPGTWNMDTDILVPIIEQCNGATLPLCN
jgi:hypothetical protein